MNEALSSGLRLSERFCRPGSVVERREVAADLVRLQVEVVKARQTAERGDRDHTLVGDAEGLQVGQPREWREVADARPLHQLRPAHH